MGKTAIAWTQETWNPLRGCSVYTKECTNCYAMELAGRAWWGGPGKAYEGLTQVVNGKSVWNGKIKLVEEKLDDPLLRRQKPALIFVNSMSDLFHKDVPEDFIQRVFEAMGKAPQHTFQVLTKRAERVLELSDRIAWHPNVWMGVSIGCQENAYKARVLASTGAKLKWVSAEPLIGPVELPLQGISWVVIGGESGPNARPMDLAWARDLMAQCNAAGTTVFVKQLGSVWAAPFTGDKDGAKPENWPADLRVREYPETNVSAVADADLVDRPLASVVRLVPRKKDPKMVAAGRKAWAIRRKNAQARHSLRERTESGGHLRPPRIQEGR